MASVDDHPPKPGLVKVKTASAQIADQLRQKIVNGQLKVGQRLPPEKDLAEQVGVSRPTVREALRTLASENLIRTSKGAAGGSYVMRPSHDHIVANMTANLTLLTAVDEVTLEEMMELRELLEAPAARLAAERRTEDDLVRLRAALDAADNPYADPDAEAEVIRGFHVLLIEASGSALLPLALQPILAALRRHLNPWGEIPEEHQRLIAAGQRKILEAVEAQDGDRAEEEMRRHLAAMRPQWERSWRGQARRRAAGLD